MKNYSTIFFRYLLQKKKTNVSKLSAKPPALGLLLPTEYVLELNINDHITSLFYRTVVFG